MTTDIRCLDEMAKEGKMELNTLNPMFRGEDAPYGYCPTCGLILYRERRPDGNDVCEMEHAFPSSENRGVPLPGPAPDQPGRPPVPSIQPDPNSPWMLDPFQQSYVKSVLDGMQDMKTGTKLFIHHLDIELTKGDGKEIDLGCYLLNLPEDLCQSKLANCGLESVDQLIGLLRAHIKAAGYTVIDDERFERDGL